jgi:hypothetical protein
LINYLFFPEIFDYRLVDKCPKFDSSI